MRRRLTSSKLDLAEKCPGSHALQWTADTSPAAENGQDGHAFLERALAGDWEGARDALPESIRDRCEGIDLEALAAISGKDQKREVAFVYDPEADEAWILGESLGRDYDLAPEGCIVGTADLVGYEPAEVIVSDFKFGRMYVPRPAENAQFRFLSLAAAREAHLSQARARLVKIDEDGRPMTPTDVFDEIALDAFAAEFRFLADRVRKSQDAVERGERPELVVGPHCRWCPAFAACPEQASAAQALVTVAERTATLTAETAPRAWQLLTAVEAACRRVRAALESFAEHEPIQLPDGSVVKPVEVITNEIDPTVAVAVLTEVIGDPAKAMAAVKPSVSQEAIKETLKSAGVKRQGAATLRKIQERGGFVAHKSTRIREVHQQTE